MKNYDTILPLDLNNLDYQSHRNILYILHQYMNDPRGSNNSRRFIYDIDPLDQGINYSQTPWVSCIMPTNSDNIDKRSADHSVRDYEFKVVIKLVHGKQGVSGHKEIDGLYELNKMQGNLRETFNNPTVINLMTSNNMSAPYLQFIDYNELPLNDKEVHEATYELMFSPRLGCS